MRSLLPSTSGSIECFEYFGSFADLRGNAGMAQRKSSDLVKMQWNSGESCENMVETAVTRLTTAHATDFDSEGDGAAEDGDCAQCRDTE
jgi:hypothetical protein